MMTMMTVVCSEMDVVLTFVELASHERIVFPQLYE